MPAPVLCEPAVDVPEHVVTLEKTLELAEELHGSHPRLGLVKRLIRNTGVQKRHTILPLEETLRHPGFEERNITHERHAKWRVPPVVDRALEKAGLTPDEIDLIVYVSCTGFMMPSMTAWLINSMGFRPETVQLPIAQMGCAAGGGAINRAREFCISHPGANALIVACEYCSMCYQPTDDDIGALLSNGLFGDATAAAVVRGNGGSGIRLERSGSYLIPDTEDWISYAVRATGFHFRLDKRVPGTMEPLAPALRDLITAQGLDVSGLGFYIIHAGGPRILDDLSHFLAVDTDMFRHSRETLTQYGNIASAVVLDALRRLFQEPGMPEGAKGIIAGFGPGITAEMAVGTWADESHRRETTARRPGEACERIWVPRKSSKAPDRGRQVVLPTPLTGASRFTIAGGSHPPWKRLLSTPIIPG